MIKTIENRIQSQNTPSVNPSLQMLFRLVQFNAVSNRSNLQIIDFIESYLLDLNVPSLRLDDPVQKKANLFATTGPDVAGGVILSGHTDVVPTVGQVWSSDPFSMQVKDGRAYGRGTCDMKDFLALALAAVPLFLKSNLKVPIHLCFSYDEEVGCTGVGSLVSHIIDRIPEPSVCIIGEPQ